MSQERTEAPTPRRRQKAREEGQVARSAELVACVVLLAVLWGSKAFMPGLGERLTRYLTETLATAMHGQMAPDALGKLAVTGLQQAGIIAAPVMGLVVAAALGANVLQVGLHATPALLQPKWNRVDPLQGFQRLFAARSAMELVKAVAKVAIVGLSGWNYLSGHADFVYRLAASTPENVGPQVGELAYGLAMQMVATLAVLAGLDYCWQRWQFERQLRMTKQEVRDDLKESEGNPDIRARIRQRQRQLARRRMMAEVPKAAVVITNPTHFALALKYSLGQKGAPTVVAKGQDLVAQRIREVAQESGVPVVENPPLARALYKAAEIGEEIPSELYRAVAEVLAMVWRLDARQRVAPSSQGL